MNEVRLLVNALTVPSVLTVLPMLSVLIQEPGAA